jgi:hypothetical protein
MSHRIDHMLPKPNYPIGADAHIDIYVQAVGPLGNPRGEHGFGMLIRQRGGVELAEFGYRSRNPTTTVSRGYLGALLSALVWRERHAPLNAVTAKTKLEYIYRHFNQNAEQWAATGKRSGKKPVENLELVRSAFSIWTEQDPAMVLMRVPDSETELAERVRNIAVSMRDHGGMEPLHKPGDPYEFEVIEEDMEDLINHAVNRDYRHEARRAELGQAPF